MSLNSAFFARAGATVLTAAVLTAVGGAAAQAHVRVIPESAAAGGFTKLTFRVPTESDTASTTALTVNLPKDTPLAFVSAQKLPGWKVAITKEKLDKPVDVEGTSITEAATKVTWTADKGSEVGPGEFQEFSLSGGPLPTGAKSISFPAEQTYSDGKVVKWDQPQAEGAEEPEFPVPSFELTAASAEGGHGAAAADDDEHAEAAAATSAGTVSTEAESDGLARAAGFGGLVVGLIGLGFGVLAWRKAGSSTGGPAGTDGSTTGTGTAA